MTYTITVTNNGPSDAQSVVLSDPLPATETFVSQFQVAGSDTFTLSNVGNQVTDTIATLPAGHSASFSITVSIKSNVAVNTVISNTASVSSSTSDPTSGNNSATANLTTVASPSIPFQFKTGSTAFWQGAEGQTLIKQLNGGLGQWLASNFPKLYGGVNGAPNLFGFTNAQVAAFFVTQFNLPDPLKLSAEVLATALNIYATTLSLGGTVAQNFGLTVNAQGLGSFSQSVDGSGAAFGVPNNTVLNVYQMMLAAGNFAVNGRPYANQTQLAVEAYSVFKILNNEFSP